MASQIQAAPFFLHQTQQSWNGSPGLEEESSPKKSMLTSGVHSLHIDPDLPFLVCESPLSQRLIRGIKQYHGKRDCNPKLPITMPILLRILEHLIGTSGDNVVLRGNFTLAFAGFLCCRECTLKNGECFDPAIHLTQSAVVFFPDMDSTTHVEVTLPASKRDPFQKGVCIILAAAPGCATCPMDALRIMFRASAVAAPDSPLFCKAGTNKPLRRPFFI